MDEKNDKDCLDPENNSKCYFFKVANAFLLLANLFLIIFGFYYLNSKEDNSYFSMIVAVLGALITVLITWQIWQTVNAYKRIDELKGYVDDKINQEKQTREFGILFQSTLRTIDEKRYLDAVKTLCMIVELTDIETFIQGSAHHIHVIIRDHQNELGDKEELREELQNASKKFKQIGITCNMAVKTIEEYLNPS